MSIPSTAIRYAGIWNAIETYKYAMSVVSPIDGKAYVWIDSAPITGGADPSVPNPNWVNIPPTATGDITGIIAGTGIGGGGSAGVVTIDNTGIITATAGTGISTSGTNPLTIGNTGVLSVDGLAGALTTKSGGWHKNTAQTISTVGAPSTVSIVWNQSSYGDIATISQNVPNGSNFTVNQHGIYLLTLQVTYTNLASATLTDRTLRTNISLTRGAGTSGIVQGNYDFADNTPATVGISSSAVYELLNGDQLFFQTAQYLSAGSFTLQSQFASPTDFDYNTYWTWTLLKPLP